MTAVGTSATQRKKLSAGARRGLWIGVVVVVLAGVVLGTRVVSDDDPLVQQTAEFDAATFGGEHFPEVQDAVADRAVDAPRGAGARAGAATGVGEAMAADPAAAAEEYAVPSSGGPVYAVTFTGVVGEGQSGIYPVAVEGMPADVLVRVQTGPAINGTDLRDATGEITFGQFTNQIDYQDAAAALNEELKREVLAGIDTAALAGRTVTVTGVFTSINPASWLVTPTRIDVS